MNSTAASCFAPGAAALAVEHTRMPLTDPPFTLNPIPKKPCFLALPSQVWSIGASCDYPSREKFDRYMRETLGHLGYPKEQHDMPPEYRDAYSYRFHVEDVRWAEWTAEIPDTPLDLSRPFSEIIVPTIDTVRYTFLIDVLFRSKTHLLCVGKTGTGKTITLANKLVNQMHGAEVTPVFIIFSARTSANQVQVRVVRPQPP